jgi:hypothetical protein
MGFVQTGVRWDDEDGEELVFELDRRADLTVVDPSIS